jgi:hypothetical protein
VELYENMGRIRLLQVLFLANNNEPTTVVMTYTFVHIKDYIEKIRFKFHSLASLTYCIGSSHHSLQNLILITTYDNNDNVGSNIFLFRWTRKTNVFCPYSDKL